MWTPPPHRERRPLWHLFPEDCFWGKFPDFPDLFPIGRSFQGKKKTRKWNLESCFEIRRFPGGKKCGQGKGKSRRNPLNHHLGTARVNRTRHISKIRYRISFHVGSKPSAPHLSQVSAKQDKDSGVVRS
ncbi:hypothetical protein ES703_10715 [subsurface metagenome]